MAAPIAPDPDAILLCQIPGLHASLLRRLLERWQTPAAVLRAPSSDLRTYGLPPSLVARIVAAPRYRAATEAGLKSLERMNIRTVSFLDASYPRRLDYLDRPPLLLYAQGMWPPPAPVVALLLGAGRSETTGSYETLVAALRERGVAVAVDQTALDLVGTRLSLAVLPFGLLLARGRVPDVVYTAVAAEQATLLSITPVNAASVRSAETAARSALVTLVDGIVQAEQPAEAPVLRPDTHVWSIADGVVGKRLRPDETGARIVARALGIRAAGEATMTQERLW